MGGIGKLFGSIGRVVGSVFGIPSAASSGSTVKYIDNQTNQMKAQMTQMEQQNKLQQEALQKQQADMETKAKAAADEAKKTAAAATAADEARRGNVASSGRTATILAGKNEFTDGQGRSLLGS